jgi:hypothetical protein
MAAITDPARRTALDKSAWEGVFGEDTVFSFVLL